jgi:hypothetical protein
MCWRRCRKLPCKTLVLLLESFHPRRFPVNTDFSSNYRLRLAENEASASDSTCPYSPSPHPSSEPLHDHNGTDDLGTGSRQIPSLDNPSRSSSQSASMPLDSVSTEPAQARGSSPCRSKRIRGRRGCFAPHWVPTPLTRRTSSSARRATGCRFHLLSMGDGVPTPFKYPYIGSTRARRKWSCKRRPEIA